MQLEKNVCQWRKNLLHDPTINVYIKKVDYMLCKTLMVKYVFQSDKKRGFFVKRFSIYVSQTLN